MKLGALEKWPLSGSVEYWASETMLAPERGGELGAQIREVAMSASSAWVIASAVRCRDCPSGEIHWWQRPTLSQTETGEELETHSP